MTKRTKGKIFWYSGIAILAGVIMFMSWSSLALSIGSLAFMLIVIGAAMGAQEYPGIMVNSHQVSEDVADYQFDGIESKRSENRGDYEFDDEIARMGDDHIQHSHELINTYPICEAKTPAFIPGIHAGDETSLTRDASCEILNIWTRKPSVQKVVKRTAGQAGIVCGANIRRDVKISHSAVKQKVLNVSSGITVLQGGEDVKINILV